MGKGSEWWESLKIGGGAAPIETSEGWLLFYHGERHLQRICVLDRRCDLRHRQSFHREVPL